MVKPPFLILPPLLILKLPYLMTKPPQPPAPVGPRWPGHLFVLDLVLHEDGLQLVALGEALQLLVGDGAHQGGLAALVGAQQAVEASEKDWRGVPERSRHCSERLGRRPTFFLGRNCDPSPSLDAEMMSHFGLGREEKYVVGMKGDARAWFEMAIF